MRFRDVNDLEDFSRDVAVVIDFIGEKDYRASFAAIKKSLNLKGFVTPFDDAMFALELDLYNLEKLRNQCSGKFQFLPEQCHAGVDFLIGLGQTIPVLSEEAKTRLLGRFRSGLKEGLWPLRHELGVAANLSKRGWDIYFHDLEEGGGYDFLVSRKELKFEVEAKAISAFTGWPIKPENVDKFLVEIKQHFRCDYGNSIPLIGLNLSGSLPADRTQLVQLVSAISEVAQTKKELSISGAQLSFEGTIPDRTSEELNATARLRAQVAKKIVIPKPTPPKLILELDSARPAQLQKKIIRTVTEAAREQFSRRNPGVIWTHVSFISKEIFMQLSSPQDGRTSFLDSVASRALLSGKRDHLSQLVFSGGSFLFKTGPTARSSYAAAVYDSPICRFGKSVVFPGGHTKAETGGSHREITARVSGLPSQDEEQRSRKNAACDLLIKEGIDGRHDADAVTRTLSLTDLAVELGRKDALTCAIAWCEFLERKGVRDEDAILLDFNRANAIAGHRYGTKWQWDQPTLTRELYYLRRAVSNQKFSHIPDVIKCMCLNNLGNRLRVAGRVIEALDCWRRTLEVRPNFGMSLCNRARAFAIYAEALEDRNDQAIFLFMAHGEASAALAPTAIYTDVRDKSTMEATKALKEQIESVLDVKGITSENPLERQGESVTNEVGEYRRWCLANCLYLNPLNDLGPYSVAAADSIDLPAHVVRLDAPHTFESFFHQMKQEYVSARWLLYEGLISKAPHFSDGGVRLALTEPHPSLSLAVEKVKAAFRASYALFDKVAFFINAYMALGIPEMNVSLRRLWRAGTKKPIRKEFDLTGNWGFCALYWLAKDFFEKENDEVAEPQARGLSDIRNHIEHKYLRVTAAESPEAPPDDLALMVSRQEYEGKALYLLKLARSALIYLTIGVRFEEQRREPDRAGASIQDLPRALRLPDAEKI